MQVKDKQLLIIFGPPAVGKTTVGKIIESKSNFKLFHNHMVMDGVMHLFGVGTPPEDKLSRIIRESVIKEATQAGMNLIFTYVWNFAKEKGKTNIDFYKNIYESAGGEVIFVELTAPLAVRAQRADHTTRNVEKKYAPNKDKVIALENSLNFTSPDPFFYQNYTKINTEDKTPEIVAEEILNILSRK
jgi:Fe-S cluster assembly ATPase SufC